MKPLYLFLGLCLAITPVEAQTPGVEWPTSTPELLGYDSQALTILNEFISENAATTGMMVVVNGKVIHSYGKVKQLSYLASCRKSVLSMLYGIYVDRGKIKLDKSLKELDIDDRQ